MQSRITLSCLGVLLIATRHCAGDVPNGNKAIPFYTGNLSVYRFMMNYGTHPGPLPDKDWASPERIAQLKRIGVTADCDYLAWSVAEPNKDDWDFSLYYRNADLLHAAGFKYVVFSWVHFPPQWYLDSREFVPYECAEHQKKLIQLSPWSPSVWNIYRRFYTALNRAMGDKIDWIRVALPSDYGEIGYPAAMTSWLVPQEHAHAGYWCGDRYAREDFRSQMKSKFGDLRALNERWGTNFVSWDELTYPDVVNNNGAKVAWESGQPTERRRWLDFIDWYQGFWLRFTPKLVETIRECLESPKPTIDGQATQGQSNASLQNKELIETKSKPLIISVGYASENPIYGNDLSAIAKMAAELRVALQAPGNVPYYATKRVSTACHFYGAAYYTEPPGDVPPEKEVARIFADVSNGVQVFFEYPNNLERAEAQVREYKPHMTGAKSIVDFAIFNPTVEHRLSCAGEFPMDAYRLGEKGRERFDFDVVEEKLIIDGALKNYRLLAYVQGSVTDEDALRTIADWVKQGGALITCDIGKVETIDGDTSVWQNLVPRHIPTLAAVRSEAGWDWAKVVQTCVRQVGKGLVIKLPIPADQTDLLAEAISYVNHNLSQFGYGLRDGMLLDGEVDGLAATLLPDRVLYYTWLDRTVARKIKFRPTDWTGSAKKPVSMEIDLRLEPHSIKAVMLK